METIPMIEKWRLEEDHLRTQCRHMVTRLVGYFVVVVEIFYLQHNIS